MRDRLGKALLELGGKDPLVVDAGVDPSGRPSRPRIGAFANAGQICTSVERIYVHRDVAEPFVDALVRARRDPAGGPGTDPATEMGPLIDAGAAHGGGRATCEDARAAGAEVVRAARMPDGPGFFYPPTVLDGPRRRRAVMHRGDVRPGRRRRGRATTFDGRPCAAANQGDVRARRDGADPLAGATPSARGASCRSGR